MEGLKAFLSRPAPTDPASTDSGCDYVPSKGGLQNRLPQYDPGWTDFRCTGELDLDQHMAGPDLQKCAFTTGLGYSRCAEPGWDTAVKGGLLYLTPHAIIMGMCVVCLWMFEHMYMRSQTMSTADDKRKFGHNAGRG